MRINIFEELSDLNENNLKYMVVLCNRKKEPFHKEKYCK